MRKLRQTDKLLSYLYPIKVATDYTDRQNPLHLQLIKGRYHLFTTHTIYSNSMKYRPFRDTYPLIYPHHPLPQSVLLLGGGLGAAIEILQRKYQAQPQATIVDINPVMRDWATEYVFSDVRSTDWVVGDAYDFIKNNQNQYDLIGVDLFIRLTNPEFVYHEDFIKNLAAASAPGGFVIINTIMHSDPDRDHYTQLLERYFSLSKNIRQGRNNYFVLQNTA